MAFNPGINRHRFPYLFGVFGISTAHKCLTFIHTKRNRFRLIVGFWFGCFYCSPHWPNSTKLHAIESEFPSFVAFFSSTLRRWLNEFVIDGDVEYFDTIWAIVLTCLRAENDVAVTGFRSKWRKKAVTAATAPAQKSSFLFPQLMLLLRS